MRIADEEDHGIEFKQSWNSTEMLKWVCGLANADGGRMFIGVRDDGEVIGLQNSKQLMEDIPNAIVSAFGMYDVRVFLRRNEDKKYIEIVVPKSRVVLEYKGVPYIKIGTTLQIMKGEMFRQSAVSRGSLSWDAYPVDGITVEDLDEVSFETFRAEAVKTNILSGINLSGRQSILNELQLLVDGKLTRAAILLFHPRPYAVFPGAYCQIGRFADEAEILYQDEIKGSLITLGMKIIEAFNTKYRYKLISYGSTTRRETQPYPDIVIREAVFNAIMHNDWSSGQPITIKVFDMKLEINNRAVLPPDWTIEHHDSLHINPLISNCFRYAGFVEKFGTGIPKMIKACMNDGNPLPEFSVFPKSISLSLKPSEEYVRKANNISALSTYSDTGSEVKENAGRCVGKDVGKDVGKALSNVSQKEDTVSRRAEILTLLGNDPYLTAEKIALILSTSSRTIERDLNLMRKNEMIRREGSRTKGRWIILDDSH